MMGEIKSALELAMERSKKYVVSDEEREEFREKEIIQKAMRLFHRYEGSHLSLHEMVREIEKMDEKTGERVKGILLSQWIDALSLNEGSGRLFDAIESIENRDISDVKQRFQNLFAAYQEEIEKARQMAILRMAEELRGEGIYGNAVAPNIDGSERWKEVLGAMDHSWRAKLDEIKKTLKGS
jgi:hypothetical protein